MENNYAWLLWFIAAIIFFVIEVLTPTFFVVCFGIGSLAAMLISFPFPGHDYIWIQLLFFVVFSIVSFFTIRPLAKKIRKNNPGNGTNVDSLYSTVGVVIRQVGPGMQLGHVKILGNIWRALSIDGTLLPVDVRVRVLKIDGTTLYVRSIGRSEGML